MGSTSSRDTSKRRVRVVRVVSTRLRPCASDPSLAPMSRFRNRGAIAIDSPPAWSRAGRSRLIERQLMGVGIPEFSTTPADPGDHSFYGWMKMGFDVFTLVAGFGYPLYTPGRKSGRCAIEVFPHASGVVLRGTLPRRGLSKRVWRREVLEKSGVDSTPLRSPDRLDAALAAVTGIHFVRGEFCVVGDPDEAVLVLPIAALPASRYQRDASELPSGDRSYA